MRLVIVPWTLYACYVDMVPMHLRNIEACDYWTAWEKIATLPFQRGSIIFIFWPAINASCFLTSLPILVFVSLSGVLEIKHKASCIQLLTYISGLMISNFSSCNSWVRVFHCCLICNFKITRDPLLFFLIVVFSLCVLVKNLLLDTCWRVLPVSVMTFVDDASHRTGVMFCFSF